MFAATLLIVLASFSVVLGAPTCGKYNCAVAVDGTCNLDAAYISYFDIQSAINRAPFTQFCADGSTCVYGSTGGKCKTLPTTRATACTTSQDCIIKGEDLTGPTHVCGSNSTCVAGKADDADCTLTTSAQCLSGICLSTNKCGTPPVVAVGDVCDPGTGKICAEGLNCGSAGKCEKLFGYAKGANCTSTVECTDGLRCDVATDVCTDAAITDSKKCTWSTTTDCTGCNDNGEGFVPIVPTGCKAAYELFISCSAGKTRKAWTADAACYGKFASALIACGPYKHVDTGRDVTCNKYRVVPSGPATPGGSTPAGTPGSTTAKPASSAFAIVPSVLAIILVIALLF